MTQGYILKNPVTKKLYLVVQQGAGSAYYPISKKEVDIQRTQGKKIGITKEFTLTDRD